ncbi:MAG: protein kinase [Ahniella sp.]|nr:protein kinase [Ahniella sp.]
MPDRATALLWIERIASAVQHAHQHLVIHRDLKPANVMITPELGVKLLDFGVAKLLDPDTADDDASTRVFTPGYASPEQLAGKAVGTGTDVYSLGRILAEVLGKDKVDNDLRSIVAKATAEAPSDRYLTMAELQDDLVAWRERRPVRAAASTWHYRLGKLLRRHPTGSVATVTALVVIVLLGWRWFDALGKAEQERARADLARVQAEQQLERSRSVVDFYARMFAGVAPEHTLGQSLAPAELLQRAEHLLTEAPPADPALLGELSASLGVLYQRLGDGENAVRLLTAGLAAPAPDDPYAGLLRADREHTLALILFDLGRNDEALAAAQRAQVLRQRFAPNDLRSQFQTELLLVNQWLGLRNTDEARAAMTRAETWFARLDAQPQDHLDRDTTRAILAMDEQRFADAASAASSALSVLNKTPDLDRTRSIELERTLARAHQALGELDLAAEAFARAIAAQREYIGDRGTRAMGLHNDYAILLATLGRFSDARAEYQLAAEVFAASGGPTPENNPRHLNNLCDADTGFGRYALAATYCQKALDLLLREERSETDPERLLVESNLARARGYAGFPAEAMKQLASVRDRALASQGPESFTATLQEFRSIRLALLAGQLDEARAFSERTSKSMLVVFPNPHPWRVRLWRAMALVSLQAGDLADAAAHLNTGEQEAIAVLPEQHPLRAQILLDRASLFKRQGNHAAAMTDLAKTLPVLRACCDEGEIDRAMAERLLKDWQVR